VEKLTLINNWNVFYSASTLPLFTTKTTKSPKLFLKYLQCSITTYFDIFRSATDHHQGIKPKQYSIKPKQYSIKPN